MKKLTIVVFGLLIGIVLVQSTAAILEDCGADGDNIVWGT